MARKLFLFFMALWLPLQAAAALAMAAEMMMPPSAHGQRADGEPAHDDAHHGVRSAGGVDDGVVDHGGAGDCDRCSLCLFVHGGLMSQPALSAGLPAQRCVHARPGDEHGVARVPEPEPRPPLLSA